MPLSLLGVCSVTAEGAVSVSLPRVCSVTVTTRDLEFGCSCYVLPLGYQRTKAALQSTAPPPAASSLGQRASRHFLSGTRMVSGKALALPRRAPGEGGPLCPDRSVSRGLELHSACCCHLLWADTVTPVSPQGSGTGPVPCSVLGFALGLCLERCALAVAGADP